MRLAAANGVESVRVVGPARDVERSVVDFAGARGVAVRFVESSDGQPLWLPTRGASGAILIGRRVGSHDLSPGSGLQQLDQTATLRSSPRARTSPKSPTPSAIAGMPRSRPGRQSQWRAPPPEVGGRVLYTAGPEFGT